VSDDEEITKNATFLATQARDPAPHYQHSEIGYNYRMSNVTAGIGRGQLIHLEEHKALKNKIYEAYKAVFAEYDFIEMNPMNPDGDANNWLSCILLSADSPVTGNEIMEALEKENIESRPIWKPMHMQPIFYEYDFVSHDGQFALGGDVSNERPEDYRYKKGFDENKNNSAEIRENAVSTRIFKHGLCLPSDIKNTDEDMGKITSIIKGLLDK